MRARFAHIALPLSPPSHPRNFLTAMRATHATVCIGCRLLKELLIHTSVIRSGLSVLCPAQPALRFTDMLDTQCGPKWAATLTFFFKVHRCYAFNMRRLRKHVYRPDAGSSVA